MNKQELIDKAVFALDGKLMSKDDKFVVMDSFTKVFVTLKVLSGHPDPNNSEYEFVCHANEFTQRAKELGWINGYKYGVEYPTNGKKPDLPDDVRVDAKDGVWLSDHKVCYYTWSEYSHFRIVDERYKPVELKEDKLESHSNTAKAECSRTLMSVYLGGTDEVFQPLPFRVPAGKVLRCYLEDADSKPVEPKEKKLARIFTAKDFPGLPVEPTPEKSWHEKGELPPVGEWVEFDEYGNNNWIKVQIRGYWTENGNTSVWIQSVGKPNITKEKFRPIKTERDKFVEAAYEILCSTDNELEQAGKLFEAGFRLPEGFE